MTTEELLARLNQALTTLDELAEARTALALDCYARGQNTRAETLEHERTLLRGAAAIIRGGVGIAQ